MALALEAIRIIDASQGVSGPLAAMLLGDAGADVIKVEPPDGDWLRQIGPFVNGESALFAQLNRNKSDVCLDLKREEGEEALRRLTQGADVIIEGYRTGAMERLGLGYEALAELNPSLVYCAISGYGSRGPMAGDRGSELDAQAFIGKNRQLGAIGDPPLRVGYDMISTATAWAVGLGILAALLHRESSGLGQKVETSLMEVATELMQYATTAESNPDEWRGRPLSGYAEPPDHAFQSKDTPFQMDFGRGEEEWKTFCLAVGAQEILEDPRFSGFRKRVHNFELRDAIRPFLSHWSFSDLQAMARGLGASIVPLHTLQTLSVDPQVEALDIFTELEHPVMGAYKTLGLPWRFSEEIARTSPVPAPQLGQHTEEVLKAAGFDTAEIVRIERARLVSPSP